jgi:hypothetical protein
MRESPPRTWKENSGTKDGPGGRGEIGHRLL